MKDLLEQVMPEFEPLPDRLEQVRRKVRARRDRKMVAGSAAAVLVVVVVGAGVVALRPTELELASAAYQECQQENVKPEIEHMKPRTENVPIGASKVTLCVYEGGLESNPNPGGEISYRLRWDLVGARDQQARSGAIERKVNALAPSPRCDTPTGEYLMVFDYPDKSRFVASLTDKCNAPVPREELLGGDLLGLLDRMERPVIRYWMPGEQIGDK